MSQLQCGYSIWIKVRISSENQIKSKEKYNSLLKKIATFYTIEEFWSIFSKLKPIQETADKISDYHIFKENITPTWEHVDNKDGGRWIFKFDKKLTQLLWEKTAIALLGQQLTDNNDEICGAVVSLKPDTFNHNVISIWNKNHANHKDLKVIRHQLQNIYNIPFDDEKSENDDENTGKKYNILEYKIHNYSIKKLNTILLKNQ